MYLRHATVNKNGKTHSYWRLVRSVRRGRKVVQETAAHLGELDADSRARARARRLALAITGGREQSELFEGRSMADEPVAVRLDQVRQDRVLAHILVCFLAYVLWKTLEQWQGRAGLGNSPRTILQELGAIHSADVVLPITTSPQRDLRLCCVVRPDRAQAALLDRLGLRLPERLRTPIA
jgi:hypothetical protein